MKKALSFFVLSFITFNMTASSGNYDKITFETKKSWGRQEWERLFQPGTMNAKSKTRFEKFISNRLSSTNYIIQQCPNGGYPDERKASKECVEGYVRADALDFIVNEAEFIANEVLNSVKFNLNNNWLMINRSAIVADIKELYQAKTAEALSSNQRLSKTYNEMYDVIHHLITSNLGIR